MSIAIRTPFRRAETIEVHTLPHETSLDATSLEPVTIPITTLSYEQNMAAAIEYQEKASNATNPAEAQAARDIAEYSAKLALSQRVSEYMGKAALPRHRL